MIEAESYILGGVKMEDMDMFGFCSFGPRQALDIGC